MIVRGTYTRNLRKQNRKTNHDESEGVNAVSCISLLSTSLVKQYYDIASNDTHPQQERLEVGHGKKIQSFLEQGILSQGFLLQILPEKENQMQKSNRLHPNMVSIKSPFYS